MGTVLNRMFFQGWGKINNSLREEIDKTIFYGAFVKLDKRTLKRRFMLHVDGSELPIMSWSAGQKEFLPLKDNGIQNDPD